MRKKGDGGDSHPAGCFACHSEESEAKFSPSRRQKNIRALINACVAGADAIFKLCASNSQPVVVNTHGLQQQAQRDIQKRDGLLGLRVVGQGVRGILISRFFLFVLHRINGGITFFWFVCLETQLFASLKRESEFQWKVKHTCQVAC